MSKLTFFRQARADGGVRTGIDVDGATLDHLEGGTNDDPALSWFVDVRFDGQDVPADLAQAQQWLREKETLVRRAYEVLGRRLQVGLDPDVMPVQCEVPGSPPGVQERGSPTEWRVLSCGGPRPPCPGSLPELGCSDWRFPFSHLAETLAKVAGRFVRTTSSQEPSQG